MTLDSYDLTSFSTIKVIIVPICPLKTKSFELYFKNISKFSTLSLAELTPPDSKTAKYSQEFYHDGCLHFEFVAAYNRDLAQLEEIEIGRQILGVIGVMNCQEVDDLHDGYKQFQQIVQRYPTSLAHRCFAFEPKADQPDDTKGIIMIPNVGDISFYLQTMMNDFTADLLLAMSLMAGQLERKTMVPGPTIISPFFTSSPGDSGATDSGTPAQVLIPAHGNGITTPQIISKDTEPGTPITSMNSTVNNIEKVKKRSPARVQKLMADLYLLAGRIEIALQTYVNAIELCKLNNDLQWQASALEGYLCAQLVSIMKEESPKEEIQPLLSSREIMELCESSKKMNSFVCELPERFREVVGLYDKSQTYGAYGYYPILQIQTSLRMANFLTYAFLASFKGTFVNCAGIPWSYEGKSLTAELALRMASTSGTLQPGSPQANSVTNTLIPQQSSAQVEKAVLQNGTGVTRLDIMTWLTRISLTGNEYLTPKDYLVTLTAICAICSRIAAHRKYAFYLRLVGTVSRYLDSKQSSSTDSTLPPSSSSPLKSWSLAAMHKVCDLLESPSKTSNDDDIWLETYGGLVAAKEISMTNLPPPPPSYSFSLRYGWPNLRIGILKEAILLSDSDKDHINTIVFTAKLLRKLFRHLTKREQQYFSDLLLRVVLQHRKQLAAEPEKTPLLKYEDGVVLGAPLVLKMEIVPSTSRYSVTQHKPKIAGAAGAKETFLYSPFAKKKTEQKDLIFAANEMVHVDVTLSNPFMFEIDVQLMCLSGTDLPFKPLAISTLIPAETRAHIVRLSCIPLQEGTLKLTGVTLRMLGGCIEETVVPLQRHLQNNLKFTADKRLRKQTDQERAGKKPLEFISGPKKEVAPPEQPWTLPISAISPQPVLELLETSLGSHQAITLFEGERSTLSFTIRNIGSVPINYIFMRIVDTMVASTTGDDLSPYETEVYQKSIRAFYPLSTHTPLSVLPADVGAIAQLTFIGELQPIKLDQVLQPGDQWSIPLGVFGKKNCTGGQIQISYGYLSDGVANDQFFTRELSVSFLLTVVPALIFRNPDTLHYSASSAPSNSPSLMAVTERSLSVEEIMMNPRLSTTMDESHDESNTFILTFDLRNEWDEPFKVTFDIYNEVSSNNPSSSSSTILHAGVTKRIILPISRFLLGRSIIQQPIPTPAGKQFVVSKSGSHFPEGMTRALFWYRQELIGGLTRRGRLVVRWSCSHNRVGIIPFREFEILPRYIPIIKSDSILIDGGYVESEDVVRTGAKSFQCTNHTHATLRWNITNNLETDVHLIFRACPVQDTPTGIASFNTSNEILFIGSANRLLDPIKVGETLSFDMKVMFSSAGLFKVIAHVEKIQEKKVVVKKSKYEAPEVVLEDIETVHWFKSGIFMNVLD